MFHCTCQQGGGLDVGAVSTVVAEEDATAVALLSVFNLRLVYMICSINS